MNRSSALLLSLVLLSGCQALAPTSPDDSSPAEEATSTPEKPTVYGSFSEETLYSLLGAELAGQRNRLDIALDNYVTQAINTQDPGIAERALRIAEYLGADQAALDTSLIWAKNAPDDLEAQRAAAIQLARNGRYDDAMVYMEKVLQAKGDTHFDFLALSASETDADTRAGLQKSFDRLLVKHPDNGQMIFGKALLMQQDGDTEGALKLLEKNPPQDGEVAPVLLRARLLQSLNRGDEALPLLKKSIRQYPDDKRLGLTYARTLMAIKKKEHDLALGNVLGSNLFNTLAVVGIAAGIAPLDVDPAVLSRDWSLMMGLTLLLLVMCLGRKGQGRINRVEGGILLCIFVAYTGWLLTSQF